ncbi:hypothetical protein [Planctomicrobium piriforme]|uniref:Uncharacterized protein n=1 Tax=Planctomicrobium piriforme TaxID=1576369 RepID=A0A1I3D2P0_9PLAN|nr:hypothetical protein [Planctomicrobium piriforme]SFH80926.1 hypothetical protein SAMN05421753_10365 [Planctomicrobium piriforme]
MTAIRLAAAALLITGLTVTTAQAQNGSPYMDANPGSYQAGNCPNGQCGLQGCRVAPNGNTGIVPPYYQGTPVTNTSPTPVWNWFNNTLNPFSNNQTPVARNRYQDYSQPQTLSPQYLQPQYSQPQYNQPQNNQPQFNGSNGYTIQPVRPYNADPRFNNPSFTNRPGTPNYSNWGAPQVGSAGVTLN